VGGYSSQDFTRENFFIQSSDFLIDDFTYDNLDIAQRIGTPENFKNMNKLVAYFGRLDININKMFFLTTTARYEGSSLFISGNKWGLYPAVGAGLDLSKMLKYTNADNLKLRMSYGLTGNQPDPQTFLTNLSQMIDLKAEKNNEFDAGIDFSFKSSRLAGSLDFYLQTTSDMLLKTFIAGTGGSTDIWLNIGKMKSSGLELTLNYNIIKNSEFAYCISFNSSYILNNTLVSRSKIVNGVELSYGTVDMGIMGGPGQWQVPLARVEAGKPIGQLLAFVFKGIDSNGNMTYVDQNHDGIIDNLDRIIAGNGLPKFMAGFGNTFNYKNWDLNIFFRGFFGYDLINSFRALYEVPFMITSYNLPVTATNMRSASGNLMINTSGNFSNYYVEKGSFISLDNMCLGYSFTLPENSSFSKLRLYLAGNNIIYITGYKGSDPNPRYSDSYDSGGVISSPLITGVDRTNTWCRTRSVTFGASVDF
jgi:iron complex outermembrane receptor protein